MGASCIDIYLVAYVAENHGKGDGVYLDILNNDGIVFNFSQNFIIVTFVFDKEIIKEGENEGKNEGKRFQIS